MKRNLTLASILAVSVFLVFSAIVSADDEVVSMYHNRPSFIDEDGDGVSDTAGRFLGRGHGWGRMYRTGFVDEDGDGICDDYDSDLRRNSRHDYVDADGDGVCDNIVDEDGDGVCDYYVDGEHEGAYGPNFVDADGDGVRDNFTGGMMRGGRGMGRHGNRGRAGK